MLTKVAYDERIYSNPRRCIEAIREHVDLGWSVVQLRGPGDGPFVVLFRKDDDR